MGKIRMHYNLAKIETFSGSSSGTRVDFQIKYDPKNCILIGAGVCYSLTNPTPGLGDTVLGGNTDTQVPYNTLYFGDQNWHYLTWTVYLWSGYNYYARAFVKNIAGYTWSDVIMVNVENDANLATISTVDPFNIYSRSGKSGGIISNDGGGTISSKGVCFNTTGDPNIDDDSTTSDGSGTADFESSMTPLNPATTYYVRAYATNSAGTAYGQEETFTTAAATIPTVILYNASDYDSSQIRLYGRIIDNGGSAIISKGFVWNLTGNPTQTSNFNSGGSGDADFNVLITGLPSGVTIYMRAVAQNSIGWGLGEVATVTLLVSGYPPTVTTDTFSSAGPSFADISGSVDFDGGSPILSRGFVWIRSYLGTPSLSSNDGSTDNGAVTGNFSATIIGLFSCTQYSYCAYAVNAIGTSYGSVESFTTSGNSPEIETIGSSSVTSNGFTITGNPISIGCSDTISSYSAQYSTTSDFANYCTSYIDDPVGMYEFDITFFSGGCGGDLTISSGNTYYFRAVMNIAGVTYYGGIDSLTTP